MRKTIIGLVTALVATVALGQALPTTFKLPSVGGVRETNRDFEVIFTPVWINLLDATVVSELLVNVPEDVAYSLDLSQLCVIVAEQPPVGTFAFSTQSGTYPTGLSLVSDEITGTPTTAETDVAVIRCTFNRDAGAATTADLSLTIIVNADESGPSTPQIGPVSVVSFESANITLETASTGGTAPLVYHLELTTVAGCQSGWGAPTVVDYGVDGDYLLEGLVEETAYCVRPAAVDDDARHSGYGTTRTFTTPSDPGPGDTTPPSQVTGVVAASNDPGEAVVTWNAAADNVAVSGYDILRGEGDGTFTETASGVFSTIFTDWPTTSYTDTGLEGGKEYYWRIKARDTSENLSLQTSARAWAVIEEAPEGPCGAGECPGVEVENYEGLTVGQLSWQASPDWREIQPRDSDKGFISSAGCRTGTRCMVSTIDRDELPAGHTNERNENGWETPTDFVGANSGTPSMFRTTQDVWLGFSVLVPAGWKAIWKKKATGGPDLSVNCDGIVVMQIHSNNPAGGVDAPPLAQDATREKNPPFKLNLSCGPNGASLTDTPAFRINAARNTQLPSIGSNTDTVSSDRLAVTPGTWTDFVMQFNYNPEGAEGTGGGYAHVWMKRSTEDEFTKIFDSDALFAGGDGDGEGFGYARIGAGNQPYWKYGGYHSFWNMEDSPTRLTVTAENVEVRTITLKYDEARWFDNSALTEAEGIAHVRPRD